MIMETNEEQHKLFNEISQETNIRKMSKDERQRAMETMSNNFDIQNNPEVGIFWYDETEDELFGVNKAFASELRFNANGYKNLGILHKDWWGKQQNKLLRRKKPMGMLGQDYTKVPRGRIWEKKTCKDTIFQMMCGKWIEDYGREHIESIVRDEFNLQNVPFEIVVDTHWDIGHGWSQEFDVEKAHA